MTFSNTSKLYITAVIFAVGTLLFFAVTLIIAFITLLVDVVYAFMFKNSFEPSKFALVLVISFIFISANHIRAITFSNRTYLGVHEKYVAVEPANRRDDLLNLM